ncbi:hypothetical protein KL927_004706 [Ogataea polymorpha]|nr:hypothetical protein KL927_004706 [Ogataea polymorpha]
MTVEERPAEKEVLFTTFSVDTRDYNKGLSEEAKSKITWSAKAEKRARIKLDIVVMSVLFIAFFALQLDRSNVSNALTGTIEEDLNMNSDQIVEGNQLQVAAICVAEIPSNVLLQMVGPSKWISLQCVLWSLVAIFQSFITDKPSYFATRWLLGMFEAGFIPGAMYYMSTFYLKHEMATRVAIFYFGNNLAGAFGNLIAAGILEMDQSWASWRYLFMIEGCITMFGALVLIIFLPTNVNDVRPMHRLFNFFSKEEAEILKQRKVVEETDNKETIFMSKKELFEALIDYRLCSHLILNFFQLIAKGGFGVFTPKLMKTFGFSTVKANMLTAVGYFGACVLSLLLSFISDRTSMRGIFCIGANAYTLIFTGVLYGLKKAGNTDKWLLFAMITLVNSGNSLSQGFNNAWLSVNARSSTKRSVGLALCVTGSNLGGILGQAMFKSKDAPNYIPGFRAITELAGGAVIWSILVTADYWYANVRLDRKRAQESQMVVENAEATEEGAEVAEVKKSEETWHYQL